MRDAPEGTPRWAAVVVNHDAGALLDRCVRSVLADASAGSAPEVVVVDNASTDGSARALASALPEVTVVSAPGNVGYARAANIGIARTAAPVVAVLNPDTELRAGTGAAMLARFDAEPRTAALGPRTRNVDGSDYPSARRVPGPLDALGHGVLGLLRPDNRWTRRYRELDADPSRPRRVDWVSGAAIWLRRSSLDAVGGFDDRYFMYVEDLDLCWRLRRAGFEIWYEPAGELVHVQGVSAARHPYRMMVEHHRSAWRFARRRLGGASRLLLPAVGVFLAVRLCLALLARAWGSRPGSRPPTTSLGRHG
jgi:N-acetylglucosaminyl-diphospho-decaprenol L-rhamnosyltransferase